MQQKPAALFSIPFDEYLQTKDAFNSFGGDFVWREMRRGSGTVLVLIYNEAMLSKNLCESLPKKYLKKLGYPVDSDISHMIDFLKRRIQSPQDFPHEIGFFLGYPHPDVIGFMIFKGDNYKYAGQWKVYGDVAHAKELSDRYKKCSECLCRHVAEYGRLASD